MSVPEDDWLLGPGDHADEPTADYARIVEARDQLDKILASMQRGESIWRIRAMLCQVIQLLAEGVGS